MRKKEQEPFKNPRSRANPFAWLVEDDAVDYEFVIDELQYTYDVQNPNLLLKVFDYSNSPQGFKDDGDGISDHENDYKYDTFGNLIKDDNKNIESITYNHLNLPVQIIFHNGNISYLYTATGQKIKKVVSSRETITTDYLGSFQYFNNNLKHIPHAEGYVNVVNGKFKHVFNFTDHLGNIRLSYSDANRDNLITQDEILEENNFYPFGLKHTAYNTNERQYINNDQINELILILFPRFTGDGRYNYKYNGKEYQDELGLNMYDYGARNYDPALGRWMNIDPLAEVSRRFSPYTYCLNNPVYFIDPDGMRAIDNEGWIKRGDEVFYDSTVTTQEQAQAVYGDDVKHYGENVAIKPSDGSYKYTLGSGGSVSLNGEQLNTSADISTPGGHTILSPDSKRGSYSGISIGGALGGGMSLEAGFVKDATGNWGAYFSFGGNIGLGGDIGLKMGDTTPTGFNPFALTDFEGDSNSFSAGIGPFGGEAGGSDGSKEAGVQRINPESWGKNRRGYEFGNGGPSLITPKLNPSLSAGAMFTGSKTWVWDF